MNFLFGSSLVIRLNRVKNPLNGFQRGFHVRTQLSRFPAWHFPYLLLLLSSSSSNKTLIFSIDIKLENLKIQWWFNCGFITFFFTCDSHLHPINTPSPHYYFSGHCLHWAQPPRFSSSHLHLHWQREIYINPKERGRFPLSFGLIFCFKKL